MRTVLVNSIEDFPRYLAPATIYIIGAPLPGYYYKVKRKSRRFNAGPKRLRIQTWLIKRGKL